VRTSSPGRAAPAQRGLGGSTIRHRLASLASLFEYLCERNAVTHNSVKGVEQPRAQSAKARRRHSAIIRPASCWPHRWTTRSRASATAPSFLPSCSTRLRREELCKLKVRDFRWTPRFPLPDPGHFVHISKHLHHAQAIDWTIPNPITTPIKLCRLLWSARACASCSSIWTSNFRCFATVRSVSGVQPARVVPSLVWQSTPEHLVPRRGSRSPKRSSETVGSWAPEKKSMDIPSGAGATFAGEPTGDPLRRSNSWGHVCPIALYVL
jgi:hypothetical protein